MVSSCSALRIPESSTRAGAKLHRNCNWPAALPFVHVEFGVGLEVVALELSLGIAGLNDGDPDAVGPQFMIQCLRISFHRMLAGAIEGSIRNRHDAKNRADVDDATSALTAHVRHHRTSRSYDAEEVGIEKGLGLLD